SEAPLLHPVRWAPDIEIDLSIAEVFADRRRLSEMRWMRTAELQRDRLLLWRKPDQPFALAEPHRLLDLHLRIEQGVPRDLAMEEPAMTVRPIHHRGHAESMRLELHGFSCSVSGVKRERVQFRSHLFSLVFASFHSHCT